MNHCDYRIQIPNIVGYPEHKRCLLQVQSLMVYGHNEFATFATVEDPLIETPPLVGVEIANIGPMNVFSTSIGRGYSHANVAEGHGGYAPFVGYGMLGSIGTPAVAPTTGDE